MEELKVVSRSELYKKFPYLKNLSAREMILLAFECFKINSDHELQTMIKSYLISHPELQLQENLNKIYED